MKKLLLVSLILMIASYGHAQMGSKTGQEGMMGQGMMGQGMMGEGMMGQGMMGQGMCPRMMSMMRQGMMGDRMDHKMSLRGLLHQWGRYFFNQKDLGITEAQLDKIDSIFNSHTKYAIRKEADRKILFIEIQELLVKEKVDLGDVERKLKAMESIETDMEMEGIRTLEEALNVLTPEQRKKLKVLFKESTYTRFLRKGMGQGGMMGMGMMGEGMMGQGGMGTMMSGMSGGGRMAGAGASPAQLTRTESKGPVTVAITYLNPQQKVKEGDLAFHVKMETHTVELGKYEPNELSTLRNDKGEMVKPLRWESSTKEGHHLSGALIFPQVSSAGKNIIGPDTRYIEIAMKDIGGGGEKVFRWDLPL